MLLLEIFAFIYLPGFVLIGSMYSCILVTNYFCLSVLGYVSLVTDPTT